MDAIFFQRSFWRRLLFSDGHVHDYQRVFDTAVASMTIHISIAIGLQVCTSSDLGGAIFRNLTALSSRLVVAVGFALASSSAAQRATRVL